MKIGILTLPLHTNYGGILQAYALQTILKDMGHDACLIDGGIYTKAKWKIILNFLKQYILSFGKIKSQHLYSFNLRKFIKNNINILDDKVKEDTFDAIIVGSDQVWRSIYTKNIEYYFLDFAKKWNIKRIAYAASFGIDYWDYSNEKTNICKSLAALFDYISVREESGIKLCKDNLNVDATMMVDPTLLLSVEKYIKIAAQNKTKINGKLLVYILDKTNKKNEVLNYLSRINHMECFSLNPSPTLINQYPSIEYWLDGFSEAEYVFTDSFHGCVFSIIFNIPFIAYANKERGMARFKSLLKLFDLENRLIYDINDLPKALDNPINWKKVNECLKTHQVLAQKTIEECLKN